MVGDLLGIRPEMIPADLNSSKALVDAIMRRQFAPSAEGKEMTDALVKTVQYALPGDALDGIPPLLIRYFLGDEHASMIGVEESVLARFAAAPLRFTGSVLSDVLRDAPAMDVLAERVGRLLIESIVFIGRGGNKPSFSIPAELRQQWGVNWTS